jgi:hypothetical protein
MGTLLISWLLNLDLPIHHMQPQRGEGGGGGKSVKGQRATLPYPHATTTLLPLSHSHSLSLSLSHTHTHTHIFPFPSNQCFFFFFSKFSFLKFGEILPKLVDFTLEKKEKKISQFLCQKIAKYQQKRNTLLPISNKGRGCLSLWPLPFTLKGILKQKKKNYEKLKIFHHAKIILIFQKNPLKETKINPSKRI